MNLRQVITTRYCAPTNSNGARLRVEAVAGYRYFPWKEELDVKDNHRAAALAFASSFGWLAEPGSSYVGGQMRDGRYAWVFKPAETSEEKL